LRFDVGDVSGIPFMTPTVVPTARVTQTAIPAPHKQLPPLDVLLVEDGETNRKLVTLLLERAGAKVSTAENGEIGCRLAGERNFDVILMDMQMPVLDGYSAARRLRDAGSTVPIIALTANAMAADRDRCLEAGCTDYLSKPINTEQLFAAVARAITSPEATAANSFTSNPSSTGSGSNSLASGRAATPDIASTLPTDDKELAEIVVEYIDALSVKLKEMEQAWDNGRLEDLAELAHWLKGSGGTAGFGVFNRPAAHLENLARQREDGDIRAALEELRSLQQRLIVPAIT
jgi:CheY-like chemotaxis protein/HPt (histidine-containing phosphotransfer) domain-containing protein